MSFIKTGNGPGSQSETENKEAGRVRRPLRPGVADFLAGEGKDFKADLKPFLPQDLIGGSLPHVPGAEEEAVWNAAAQACGTEKVHFVYTVEKGKVWYLACPSQSLASSPDTWCPLAAALPGGSEFWDMETVYLYEQDGTACALRWDPETGRMQVFLGASRTILPRVQSMDSNFVTINPEVADMVSWRNRGLKTEKMARATARMLIIAGLIGNLIIAGVLSYNLYSIGYIDRNLTDVKAQTDQAALDLMRNAANIMQSDTIRHMVRVQQLMDDLARVNGYLVRYDVNGGKIEWEAIVPQAFAAKLIQENSGAEVTGTEEGDHVRVKGRR
ncbi:MAG: hypothetical protein KDI13_00630 [Alphaproteobacteria bacterium]|nr:hypothetical protein [Alphaproteobacteria bacterium]